MLIRYLLKFLDALSKLTLTGPASVQELLEAGVVYTDSGRAWLSAWISDPQTRTNVDHLIMRPAGYTPRTDLLEGLDLLHLSTLVKMGCSGGWVKF